MQSQNKYISPMDWFLLSIFFNRIKAGVVPTWLLIFFGVCAALQFGLVFYRAGKGLPQ